MRPVKGLVGLGAVAAATAAMPAAAGQVRWPWAKVGEWEIGADGAGACSADRVYPGGTVVSIAGGRGRYAGLRVLNRRWSMQTAGPYRMSLVQGGARRRLAAEANPYLHGLSVVTESGAGLLAQLARGGILELAHPDGRRLERLDLGELAPVLAKLRACISQGTTAENDPPVAAPPPPGPPLWIRMRPARAPATLASLFSSDDYPAAAIRAGEQGAVGFRLDVARDGGVAACTITASSGSAALDSTTCQLLTMRARFQPARDREGKPTEDKVSGRIFWRLPQPEPPPPPP